MCFYHLNTSDSTFIAEKSLINYFISICNKNEKFYEKKAKASISHAFQFSKQLELCEMWKTYIFTH